MQIGNRFVYMGYFIMAAAVCGWVGPVGAVEVDDAPLVLVAKPALHDRLYGATILVVKPVNDDQHIGFIVNKPTRVTLGKLFPDHEPSRKVTEPIYLGGPVNSETIFALVQRGDSPGRRSVRIAPDIYLAHEREVVDRIIETEADHARFFAGLVLWRPGELRAEVRRGFWYVLDAEADLVLPKSTEGLWEDLVRRSVQKENSI